MTQPLAIRYGSISHFDAPKREARFAPINASSAWRGASDKCGEFNRSLQHILRT
jgi:hypothetical protein